MKEIWKDIKGYEGLYKISNYGRIKTIPRYTNNQNSYKEIILKYTNDGKGYQQVILTKNRKRKGYKVHRLVAENFLDKNNFKPMLCEDRAKIDLNKLEVNHKNEFNKEDNSINNLEWCTKLYNCNYGTRNKRVNKGKPIYQLDLEEKIIREWDTIKQASEKLNIQKVCIASCCRKKQKTAGGYKWKYKEEI